jgi:molecular chaperone DnaK
MADIFGLDFGTTNSLAATIAAGRALAFRDQERRPIPSVVLYRGEETIVGRRAKDELDQVGAGVIGEDAVRSPKTKLGSGRAIHVAGVAREPREVVAEILRHVREQALEHDLNREIRLDFGEAVMTIPVKLDGRGRQELRAAAADAGILVRQFVHEPLAALYGYLRELPDWRRVVSDYDNKLVLVFDWGGGTLDLTLCQVLRGTLVQVHNRGDDRVGGDQFDERLRYLVRRRHAEQHGLEALRQQPGAEAKLLNRCEQAKISLSTAEDAPVFVPNYLSEEGLASRVELTVYRHELEELTEDLVQKGMSSIDRLLELADVSDSEIEFVLATGGMVQMPVIRRRLRERFGPARVPEIVDANELIAKGAAWIAHDQQRVRLSKPLEVLLANDATTSLVGPEVDLPVRDQEQQYELHLRCVDPRDGFARIQFTRPVRPGRVQPTDDRLPYSTLLLPVNSTADPLLERLIVEVHIDHDFVVHVAARSKLTGEEAAAEIHGLEFGLALSNGV